MKYAFCLFCINILAWQNVHAQNDKERAQNLLIKATELIQAKNLDSALHVLQNACSLAPKTALYHYELGYVCFLKKDYDKAIEHLKKAAECSDASDKCYQLLGTTYLQINNPAASLDIYKKGIKKFPQSPRLYAELGVVAAKDQKHEEAVRLWEQGIASGTDYPDNYYHLATHFARTEDRIWAILYAETFMNLEQNSPRTDTTSRILFTAYQQSVFGESGDLNIDFALPVEIDMKKSFKFPFSTVYEAVMNIVAPNAVGKETKASIVVINRLREHFLNNWYESGKYKNYPNYLFDFQKELKDRGFLACYDYWLFMGAQTEEFQAWYGKEENRVRFEDFIAWFAQYPLKIENDTTILRTNYLTE